INLLQSTSQKLPPSSHALSLATETKLSSAKAVGSRASAGATAMANETADATTDAAKSTQSGFSLSNWPDEPRATEAPEPSNRSSSFLQMWKLARTNVATRAGPVPAYICVIAAVSFLVSVAAIFVTAMTECQGQKPGPNYGIAAAGLSDRLRAGNGRPALSAPTTTTATATTITITTTCVQKTSCFQNIRHDHWCTKAKPRTSACLLSMPGSRQRPMQMPGLGSLMPRCSNSNNNSNLVAVSVFFFIVATCCCYLLLFCLFRFYFEP
ncbi:unnamed protein product, partial [Polarella glacialis]